MTKFQFLVYFPTLLHINTHVFTYFFVVNQSLRPQQINQSKQALSNMLRQRHPLNTFMGPGGQTAAVPGPQNNAYPSMQRYSARQQLRQPHPSAMQANQVSSTSKITPIITYLQHNPLPSQNMFQQQYANMQQPMSQQYGAYSNAPPSAAMMQPGSAQMQSAGQPMMQGGQSSMFPAQQQSFAQNRAPQPDYRGMPQAPRAPYMQQAPNVTMNANLGQMGQMGAQGGPAPPYSRTGAQAMQQQQQQQSQFQQQQRMRQQMLAMQQQQQQQQQQQGGPGSGQPSPALMAQLQRHMNPNPYQHQPPPYNM